MELADGCWVSIITSVITAYYIYLLFLPTTYSMSVNFFINYTCGKVKDSFNSSRKSSFPQKIGANVLFLIWKYEIISEMVVDAKTGYGYKINLLRYLI